MASNLNPEALLIRLEAVEDALRLAFDSVRKIRVELQPGPPTPLGLDRLREREPLYLPPEVDPTWIPILHSVRRAHPSWPEPCGQVGLYLTEPPREHEKASLERMRIFMPGETQWREPTVNDLPLCSSCGQHIDPFSNADLDYLSHMIPGGPAPFLEPSQRKRRDRRKSGGEPPQTLSPGGGSEMSGSPSTFPGHTREAQQEVLQGIEALSDLARSAGLFDGRA